MNFKALALTLALCTFPAALASTRYISSSEQYNSYFSSSKPMITMYTSPSCGPCRQMKPSFYKAAQAHPDLSFYLVDIDKPHMKDILQKLQIQSIPTVIFSCNGKVIRRTRGCLSKNELEQEIAQFKNSLPKSTTIKKAPSTVVSKGSTKRASSTPRKVPVKRRSSSSK